MVRDEDVGAELRRVRDRLARRIERQHHAGDLSVRVARQQSDAVPVLGPLRGKAMRDGALDVGDDDGAHSSIDLQPPEPFGNWTSVVAGEQRRVVGTLDLVADLARLVRIRAHGHAHARAPERHEQVVARVQLADRLAQACRRDLDEHAGFGRSAGSVGVELTRVERWPVTELLGQVGVGHAVEHPGSRRIAPQREVLLTRPRPHRADPIRRHVRIVKRPVADEVHAPEDEPGTVGAVAGVSDRRGGLGLAAGKVVGLQTR